jgi:hypothetical protein
MNITDIDAFPGFFRDEPHEMSIRSGSQT